MLVCVLKAFLVTVLTISERGSKYPQVGHYDRSHGTETAAMFRS